MKIISDHQGVKIVENEEAKTKISIDFDSFDNFECVSSAELSSEATDVTDANQQEISQSKIA